MKIAIAKDLFQKLFLILFGLILGFFIFLIAVELFLRETGSFELQCFYDTNDMMEGFGQHMRDSNTKGFRVSKYPGIGWEVDPQYPPMNSYDRFSNLENIKKDKNIYRIIAIGDSVTQAGYYEKFLEEMLNNSNLDYKFEVWNCGVAGYGIFQYYYYFKYNGIRFNPDMIILSFTFDDLSKNSVILMTKDGYIGFKNPFSRTDIPINKYMFLHSRCYRFLLYNLENILEIKKNGQNPPYLIFNDLINLAKVNNIKIVALIWPYLKNKYNNQELQNYSSIKNMLEEYSIPYLDLYNSFDNLDLSILRISPQDYVHPSKEAYKIVTPDIYNFLINNFNFGENKIL